DLQEEFGLAMLFISHDLAVVSSLCDDLLVLRGGKAVEQGAAQQILAAPKAEYTRTLIAAAQVAPRIERTREEFT
ncbi:peptide ABC transporter ATP-binding protein, partial [Cribrihabitans sp. XS_ASV171]